MKHKGPHKYVRVKMGSKDDPYIVYKCTLGCPHYMRRELAVGMESLCNRCDDPFIMSVKSITLAKPHCNRCGITKQSDAPRIEPESIEDIMGKFGVH